jgi:hypothetical protein
MRNKIALVPFLLIAAIPFASLSQKIAVDVATKKAIDEKYLVLSSPFYVGKHLCSQGLYRAPSGPFSAFLFCNAALGDSLGLVFEGFHMAMPAKGNWDTSKRFWQEEPFSDEVTSFAWSKDGMFLYVGTSGIYGDGGFFELDLMNQKVKRLYPVDSKDKAPKTEYASFISKHDPKAGKLEFVVIEYGRGSAIPRTVASRTINTKVFDWGERK